MAWNVTAASPSPTTPLPPSVSRWCRQGQEVPYAISMTSWALVGLHQQPISPCRRRRPTSAAASSSSAGPEGVAEEQKSAMQTGSSARSQLDLLEQLASTNTGSGYESDGSSRKLTIREQLAELVGDRGGGEFTLPLGKMLKSSVNSLTISQKRNIKRQAYLNEVSTRNDSVFFATIGAFVILPPIVILAVAVLTGYVQLLP